MKETRIPKFPKVLCPLLLLLLASSCKGEPSGQAAATAGALQEEVDTLEELKALEKRVREVARKGIPATVALVSPAHGASGTGVIVSKDGLLLTAAHVVAGLEEMLAILPDGHQVKVRVLGANYSKDVAMARLSGRGPWPFVKLGDSARMRTGDWVLALGHAEGFKPGRTAPVRFGRLANKRGGGFLVTDCAIIGGDSDRKSVV